MFSLEYFEKAFDNNSKLDAFVIEIKEDFIRFENEFFIMIEEEDFTEMTREIHKMETIVSQLKFKELQQLFEAYKKMNIAPTEIIQLNKKLSILLHEFHVEIDKYITYV